MVRIELLGLQSLIFVEWCEFFTRRDGELTPETNAEALLAAKEGRWLDEDTLVLL